MIRFDLKSALFCCLLVFLLAGCGASPNVITWETASEVDTAGFNLYRGPGEDGPWTQVNDSLIPPADDPVQGGQYEFTDSSAEPGTSYYYLLEEVELSGATTRYPPTQLERQNESLAWPWWVLAAFLAIGLGWWLGTRFQRKERLHET